MKDEKKLTLPAFELKGDTKQKFIELYKYFQDREGGTLYMNKCECIRQIIDQCHSKLIKKKRQKASVKV